MIAAPLQKLLDRLDGATPIDPATFQQAIYDARFTGAVTTHYRNGVPQQVDLGAPVKLTICAGARTDTQGGR